MTDTKIIAQLTRENLSFKECLLDVLGSADKISIQCVGCGGPLNDNIKLYTSEQMKDFWTINEEAEYIAEYIRSALSVE